MIKYLLIILPIVILSGCYSANKAGKQMAKAYAFHPAVAADNCGLWFPIKEKEVTKVEYKQGKTDTINNYVIVDCDTVTNTVTKVVKVKCPPSTHTVDTFIKEVVLVKENTANLMAKTVELDQCTKDSIKAENQGKNRGLWLIVLASYLVIKSVLRLALPKLNFILNKLP